MPLTLRVSDGTELPLATNAGWGEAGRWMEQQANSPVMHQLFREGWAEPASALLEELQTANDLNPPINIDCGKTVLELIDTLDTLDPDEAVVVTDGVELDLTENCGGPGSGKPGPCPHPSIAHLYKEDGSLDTEKLKHEKCFACDRKLKKPHVVTTSDGQFPCVGPECHSKIKKAAKKGYQPPLGGPKLFSLENDPKKT